MCNKWITFIASKSSSPSGQTTLKRVSLGDRLGRRYRFRSSEVIIFWWKIKRERGNEGGGEILFCDRANPISTPSPFPLSESSPRPSIQRGYEHSLKARVHYSDSVIRNPTPLPRRLLQPSKFSVGMSDTQRSSLPEFKLPKLSRSYLVFY